MEFVVVCCRLSGLKERLNHLFADAIFNEVTLLAKCPNFREYSTLVGGLLIGNTIRTWRQIIFKQKALVFAYRKLLTL